MSGVLFNEFKGYHLAKGNQGLESHQLDKVITDGFDQLNWDFDIDNDEDQKKIRKSGRKKYKDYYHEFEDLKAEEPDKIYDSESKTHMNHESSLINEEIDIDIDKLTKRQQRQYLKSKHKAQKKSKLKKPLKRNKNDTLGYDQPSDPNKVIVLNRIYSEITKLTKNSSNDEKIIQFFDVSIYKEDLDNLKDDEWLNDNNLSFIYEYLERYLLNKHSKLVSNSILLLRPSMSYLLANFPNPIELKNVIPALEESSVKFIFLPVNDNDDVEMVESGSHWSLVVISILDKTAFIFDTLERANEKEAKVVIDKVTKYLNNGTKFKIIIIENTPQQINGSDCGIMVCQLTGFLLSRLLNLKDLTNNFMNFDMENVEISAIDGRIFALGSILNIIKHKIDNLD